MGSKLGRFCEGLMEAAWLAAVVLIPVFFNVYSSRIFEPDKIAILRSLALLILAAWMVKLIESGGIRGERLRTDGRGLFRIPLILPVAALVVLYLIATIFSITPRVSLLGSYQRLQGTYTTFSYLVIFLALIGNVRRREQVERIITTIVVASLPVALYGVLQKYGLDPVPWGGNVQRRIAANMGNSIFVAAYLIMVFPLTIARMVSAFRAILKEEKFIGMHVLRATGYVFIGSLQVIAIYMSGSRGPALGWMASAFFLFLLLSLQWRKRWVTLSIIGLAGALGGFLLLFNVAGGPFEQLRQSDAIGRFGMLLDTESNTAKVRQYIWQGAAELVLPHEPLQYPDGHSDPYNFLRPIIGYGPESMYVAYNPFYVPELAQVEKRNASPDRSHNETWDSLVITGFLGILVYLTIFTFVFYYGLKWLGLIDSRRQKWIYFITVVGTGVIAVVVLGAWRGAEYFGVALPFGMLIGLLLFITQYALFASFSTKSEVNNAYRSILLMVLIAAIIAHFVEINFGIAIAVTRTYFWVYAALLLLIGYVLPQNKEYFLEQDSYSAIGSEEQIEKQIPGRKKKSSGRRSGRQDTAGITTAAEIFWFPGLLTALVLIILGYDYISNPRGLTSAIEIVWMSLTRLQNKNNLFSFGILALCLTTWIWLVLLNVAEELRMKGKGELFRSLGYAFGISGGLALFFWLWHAGALAGLASTTANTLEDVLMQIQRYENLLGRFYMAGFLVIVGMAVVFAGQDLRSHTRAASLAGMGVAFAGLIGVIWLAAFTNLRVIQADIVFKLADPFTRNSQWRVAIEVYNRANKLAPNEDYYYLFLGRAYLEAAKSLSDPAERDRFIGAAETDLKEAQDINPLNTDHTANLARLYSLWAGYVSDADEKRSKGEQSSEYFAKATTLSPKNARLWGEWALVYLNVLRDGEKALERLEHALEIDPEYHWSYALMGEYYQREARQTDDEAQRDEYIASAVKNYQKALDLPTPGEPQAKYSYAIAMGNAYSVAGNYAEAIRGYELALEYAPAQAEIWQIEDLIGKLYVQMNDPGNALVHLNRALELAPDDQKPTVESIIQQIQP